MTYQEILLAVRTLALLLTAGGVIAAFVQISQTRKVAVAEFENGLYKKYRAIIKDIPVTALLGHDSERDLRDDELNQLYHYIDLCNEQVFLRQIERIGPEIWQNWCSGIEGNLRRAAFRKAWERIKRESHGDFAELRRQEESGFEDDPASWG